MQESTVVNVATLLQTTLFGTNIVQCWTKCATYPPCRARWQDSGRFPCVWRCARTALRSSETGPGSPKLLACRRTGQSHWAMARCSESWHRPSSAPANKHTKQASSNHLANICTATKQKTPSGINLYLKCLGASQSVQAGLPGECHEARPRNFAGPSSSDNYPNPERRERERERERETGRERKWNLKKSMRTKQTRYSTRTSSSKVFLGPMGGWETSRSNCLADEGHVSNRFQKKKKRHVSSEE